MRFKEFVARTENNESLDWLTDPSYLALLGTAGAMGVAGVTNTLNRMKRARRPSERELNRAMGYYTDLIKQYVKQYGPDSEEVEKLAAQIEEAIPAMKFIVKGYRDDARFSSQSHKPGI